MSKQDDDVLKVLLGGLIGAAIASPKLEDKQDLERYRQMQREMNERQKKVGDLSYITKLLKNPKYDKSFIEAYRMYIFGFFRGSVILSSAIIECLLREKYGDKDFYQLIEEAKKQGFIELSEYHFLHAIRTQRNISAHDVLKDVSEDDAILVIRIVNKIMHRFI